jgi:glucan-binding YG repeat protein
MQQQQQQQQQQQTPTETEKQEPKQVLIYDDNEFSVVCSFFVIRKESKGTGNGVIVTSCWLLAFQEERRAALEKYSYTKEKIEAQVSRLDQTIESRITSIGGLSSINFLE